MNYTCAGWSPRAEARAEQSSGSGVPSHPDEGAASSGGLGLSHLQWSLLLPSGQ